MDLMLNYSNRKLTCNVFTCSHTSYSSVTHILNQLYLFIYFFVINNRYVLEKEGEVYKQYTKKKKNKRKQAN